MSLFSLYDVTKHRIRCHYIVYMLSLYAVYDVTISCILYTPYIAYYNTLTTLVTEYTL